MKKRIRYRASSTGLLLLFIYLLNPFRLFLPHLEYKVNYDYIVNFLCENKDKPELNCNGKCYLSNALNKTHQSPSNYGSIVTKNTLTEDVPAEPIKLFKAAISIEKANSPFQFFISCFNLENFTPPPEYIA